MQFEEKAAGLAQEYQQIREAMRKGVTMHLLQIMNGPVLSKTRWTGWDIDGIFRSKNGKSRKVDGSA